MCSDGVRAKMNRFRERVSVVINMNEKSFAPTKRRRRQLATWLIVSGLSVSLVAAAPSCRGLLGAMLGQHVSGLASAAYGSGDADVPGQSVPGEQPSCCYWAVKHDGAAKSVTGILGHRPPAPDNFVPTLSLGGVRNTVWLSVSRAAYNRSHSTSPLYLYLQRLLI